MVQGNCPPYWRLTAVRLDKLEVVASFCYLGDMLSAGGGCDIVVTTTHVKTAWKKFRELLPVLTSCHLSYKASGHVYSSCVWSACSMPVKLGHWWAKWQGHDLTDLQYQARGCGNSKLEFVDLDLILRERRLGWFGHVERSNGAVRTACDIQVECKCSQGGPSWYGRNWPKMTVTP